MTSEINDGVHVNGVDAARSCLARKERKNARTTSKVQDRISRLYIFGDSRAVSVHPHFVGKHCSELVEAIHRRRRRPKCCALVPRGTDGSVYALRVAQPIRRFVKDRRWA